ncbi:glycerophosphodiester phosphodiesterase family protein [Dyella sp. 2RAB6]|uniref:glycerophosphodiester phosphodiesterase family protein n=1 Tax=Dyella sp. 2RAB6 TaxID=3232992 RepID=UPI003F902437
MSIRLAIGILLSCAITVALAWLAVERPFAGPPPLPALIAHRCGTADAPENTLTACRLALSYGVKKLWVSVQVSRDGVPVLYRPRELAALTDGAGDVAEMSYASLANLNAGWHFQETGASGAVTYPYRNAPVHIPALEDLIEQLPEDVELFVDIKTPDAARAAQAIADVLQRHGMWNRTWIYSTLADNLRAFDSHAQAHRFEAREQTRQRLATLAMEQRCANPPAAGARIGFELRRAMEVTEPLTLGPGTSKVSALLWNARSMECFNAANGSHITLFGINSERDYQLAATLGADAVMVDSPKAASAYRPGASGPLRRLLARWGWPES